MNLQRVYLRQSGVREVHPDAFHELIILIEVDLCDNEIEVLHANTFFGNERLRVLTLSRNPLTKLVSAQFPSLPHLR